MIVCSCREISTNNFATEQELTLRIMQSDAVCGCCQEGIMDDLLLKDERNNTTKETQK